MVKNQELPEVFRPEEERFAAEGSLDSGNNIPFSEEGGGGELQVLQLRVDAAEGDDSDGERG